MKWLALALLSLTACQKPSNSKLTVEAYVWQSPTRPEVQLTMTRAATHAINLHVRAAEMRWAGDHFETERTLTHLPSPGCGLVVRIGASASQLEWTPEQIKPVATIFRELAALGPKEIQCDFDSPQKRLSAYNRLLNALQSATGDVPIVPTTLPS